MGQPLPDNNSYYHYLYAIPSNEGTCNFSKKEGKQYALQREIKHVCHLILSL